MKTKTYIFLFFLIISNFGFSQDAGFRKTSISSSFSPVEIEAYQESADKKIEDFYSYLNLLSDKYISQKVKTEIKEGILLLFKNNRLEVVDFISDENTRVSLSAFLDKVEKSESIRFKLIKKEDTVPELSIDYWFSEYTVEVELNGEKYVNKISKKVNLSPVYKQFGNTYKEVWEIKLGEME